MLNAEKLRNKIKESGKKKGYIAEKVGLSRQGFKNCLDGVAFFNTSHISVLCKELNITTLKERNDIFFAD